jgi:peptidyl-tRNA hydrolase
VPVIWVNAALKMTVGKAAAQVGHAAMLYAAARGLTAVPAFAVRDAEPDHWEYLLSQEADGAAVAVRDGGFTEVAPGTVTCVTVDP